MKGINQTLFPPHHASATPHLRLTRASFFFSLSLPHLIPSTLLLQLRRSAYPRRLAIITYTHAVPKRHIRYIRLHIRAQGRKCGTTAGSTCDRNRPANVRCCCCFRSTLASSTLGAQRLYAILSRFLGCSFFFRGRSRPGQSYLFRAT